MLRARLIGQIHPDSPGRLCVEAFQTAVMVRYPYEQGRVICLGEHLPDPVPEPRIRSLEFLSWNVKGDGELTVPETPQGHPLLRNKTYGLLIRTEPRQEASGVRLPGKARHHQVLVGQIHELPSPSHLCQLRHVPPVILLHVAQHVVRAGINFISLSPEHPHDFVVCKEMDVRPVKQSGVLIGEVTAHKGSQDTVMHQVGNGRDDFPSGSQKPPAAAHHLFRIPQVLQHVPEQDIIKGPVLIGRVTVLDVPADHVTKFRCDPCRPGIDLHAEESRLRILVPDPHQIDTAVTANLQNGKHLVLPSFNRPYELFVRNPVKVIHVPFCL